MVSGAGGWELENVEGDRESYGFQIMTRRWIVERSIAWACRNQRLAKDYKRMVQTSETLIEVAMIRLIVRRLARVPLEPHTN